MASVREAWLAKGKTWDTVLGQPSNTQSTIIIKEEPLSVSFQGNTEAYGQPVNVNVAINLIKAFLIRLKAAGLYTPQKQNEESEQYAILVEMLNQSMGMTYDKSLILKILSQPKCEGIRFYLCEKKGNNDKDYISLVLVGVNEKGEDLHYDSVQLTNNLTENTSLTGEYGHPPVNKLLDTPKEMALLTLAKGLIPSNE